MKSNSNDHSNNQHNNEVPADVRPYDILCGRSKTCFNNIGNRRFRITISMNLKKYDSLLNRTERSKFIYTLAQTLKEDAGFRFVRISKKNGRVELTDEEIRAKIGHALRDLSKAQAEATAAAAKPAEEAKKFMESAKQSPVLRKPVVTPQQVARKVSNEDSMATADMEDIRKEMMTMVNKSSSSSSSDHQHHISSQTAPSPIQQQQQQQQVGTASLIIDDDDISDVTQDITTLPQHEMLPDCEEADEDDGELLHLSMKMPALEVMHATESSSIKPAPISHTPFVEHNNKVNEIGDDAYCLMPLRFDAGILEPASKSTLNPPSSAVPFLASTATIKPVSMMMIQKAKELGDDDYCLMPLQFDAGILEPASKSTFDIDESSRTIEEEFQRRCSLV